MSDDAAYGLGLVMAADERREKKMEALMESCRFHDESICTHPYYDWPGQPNCNKHDCPVMKGIK